MNIDRIHEYFKVEMDKNAVNIGLAGCPSLLPEEIDYWLYAAELMSIKTKFSGNNAIQTGFEGNSKRISDLEKLIKTDKSITLLSETGSNKLTMNNFTSTITYGSTTQEKRMLFVSAILHFGTSGANALVNLISHDQAYKFLQTYNNKPWIEQPMAVIEEDKLIVYVDQDLMNGPYTIDLTYLAYPRKPNNEDITSGMDDIPEQMQYEIIKLAANMALENIESQRSQIHSQYIGISE